MSIYQNVKTACLESNITVNALEKELNFPRSSICKWDKNTPGIDKVKAVADYFQKPIEYFLS
ncbi:MAG: XRE family transcriptional regulator [[Clostridium] scindens]|uniref:XRE family transcriptional regulator n=1 Tax=Clostridium scindens (strain JCM 10418 / VPI 12708) TaxID=29347 RepID=UPI003995D1B0